jgi:hypothetical protein
MPEIKEKIICELKKTNRAGIEDLIDYLDDETDFFNAPASTKYHGNYLGGLAEHSWNVKELFMQKNETYFLGLPEDTIIICGLCHDLCKCNFYKRGKKNVKEGNKLNAYGKEVANWVEKEVWEIDDKFPLSHGHKSVIILQRFIKLTEFEICAMAWHMGFPEEYEMKQAYSKATEKYPAIVALHTADYESSYFLEKTIKE